MSLAVLPYTNQTLELFYSVFQTAAVYIPIYVFVDTALSKRCPHKSNCSGFIRNDFQLKKLVSFGVIYMTAPLI